MHLRRLLLISCLSICSLSASAQVEGSFLTTKDFSAVAWGAFFNFKIPASEGTAVTIEVGFQYAHKDPDWVVLLPMLAGYRRSFNGEGDGLYVEPMAGYSIGESNLSVYDELGFPLSDVNGESLVRKAKGITAGVAGGYIFPGSAGINLSLRYLRVFVPSDPSLNLISLRLLWPLFAGMRN